LEIGFSHTESFAAVGATQPAISGREAELAELAAAASAPMQIRLLSSEADPFLEATRKLSAELRVRQVPHALSVVPGPHNARFNRGPGGIEMLLHYDRELGRR
jgi:enterochelin esterase-like enzyme